MNSMSNIAKNTILSMANDYRHRLPENLAQNTNTIEGLVQKFRSTTSPIEQGNVLHALDKLTGGRNQIADALNGKGMPNDWGILDIDFDLNDIQEEIVVIGQRVKAAVCPASPIQITAGADAYLGIGASASLGGSIDLTTGQLRFVTDAALGAGVGAGVGVNIQKGQASSGASFASQITASYIASATVAASVEEFGNLPDSPLDYSLSGGGAGAGLKAGLWGNNSITYTSPATPKLYDIYD